VFVPVSFCDTDEEAKNYCNLVRAVYKARAEERGDDPSAESVFPGLCQFARENGLVEPMQFVESGKDYVRRQEERLASCVQFAFKRAPFQAASIIMGNAAPNQTGLNQAETQERHEERIVRESVAMPAKICREEKDNRPMAEKPVAITTSASSEEKISPYAVAQELLRCEKIKIIGEALFVYQDGFYKHISAECLRRLILKDCRAVVEAVGTPKLVDDVFKFLLCEPEIFHDEELWDEDLIVFDNGVLDVRNGNLLPHSHKYNVFYRLQTWWGDRSPHPCFDEFMHRVTGGDGVLKQRILEVIGYALSPDNGTRALFLFQGVTASGKTLLSNFLKHCVNPDCHTGLPINKMAERFSVANLVGKQLCMSLDLPATPLNAEVVALLKSLTGGDPITADVKYRPHITFVNRAKIVSCTNHPLLLQAEDAAFLDRLIAVPFWYSVPEEQRNGKLLKELNAERAAIVYDAIQAYRALRERNYRFSGEYAVNSMFSKSMATVPASTDALIVQFVMKYCTIKHDAVTFVDDLYRCYCEHFPAASVAENWFGAKVLEACGRIGLAGVYRGSKRRKEGQPNPQANIVGLCLREDV